MFELHIIRNLYTYTYADFAREVSVYMDIFPNRSERRRPDNVETGFIPEKRMTSLDVDVDNHV